MANLTDDGRVRRVPFLCEKQCRAAVEQLTAVGSHWTERGRGFFTLGAAAYIDLCRSGHADYRNRSEAGNPVIRSHFGSLLERLAKTMEHHLGEPCIFRDGFALPGFHIFQSRSLDAALRDNFHLDLQHSHFGQYDYDTPSLTFTLALQLPEQGGGIELCLPDERNKRGRIEQHPYALGEIFVHSGRALHRRIHRPAGPECRRITLQGHAVRDAGQWVLYW